LSGSERHALEKESKSLDRQIANQRTAVEAIHAKFAEHDQSDYQGLSALTAELATATATLDELELRWLEVAESLGL
jgi:hypothetical protein